MDSYLAWISKYSAPVVILFCIAGSILFVVKLVTEKTIENEFSRLSKELNLRLERRSQFEQLVMLERYKLIADFSSRLSQVGTNINRTRSGQKVEGFMNGNELVPLTVVYEDLAAKRFQLSEKFHSYFLVQAGIVPKMANAKNDEEYGIISAEYIAMLSKLNAMVNEEFRTEQITW